MIADRYRIGKTFVSITTPIDAQERIKASVESGGGTYVCVSDPRTVDFASNVKETIGWLHRGVKLYFDYWKFRPK